MSITPRFEVFTHRVHRFFSRAAWDPRKVGLALTGAVIDALVPAGEPVRVAVDDTLLRRRGKKDLGGVVDP